MPPISYAWDFWCACSQSAELWYLDETTNDNGWVNISSNYNSYFSWISSFVTASDDSTGNLSIYSTNQATTQTVKFWVKVWSHGDISSGPLEWEYDVTVYKACIDNVLTNVWGPSDISYVL